MSSQELEEFWAYKALLTELTRRLTYCVQAELIPLMEVVGVMEVCLIVKSVYSVYVWYIQLPVYPG